MYIPFVGIPVSIMIKEDDPPEKFKCRHCACIIKNKYLLINDEIGNNYKAFCSKCAKIYLETLEAKFKYFADQIKNISSSSFPKAKKENHGEINITTLL